MAKEPDAMELFQKVLAESQGAPDQPAETPPPEPAPETPESETPPEPTPSTTPVLDYYREQGADVSAFKTDLELTQALQQRAALNRDNEYRASQYAQLEGDPEFRAWQESRSEAPPKEEKPEEDPEQVRPFSDWNAPSIDPEWEHMCDYDPESNGYVLKDKWRGAVSPDIPKKLTEARRWNANTAEKLVREFPQLMEQGASYYVDQKVGDIESRIEAKMEEMLQQRMENYEDNASWNDFLTKNAEILYEFEDGQVKFDGPNPATTEEGQKVQALVEEAYKVSADHFGVESPSQKFVTDYVSRRWSPPAPAAAPPNPDPAPTQASSHDLKEAFEKEERRQLADGPENRRVAEAAARAATEELSAKDMLLEQARKDGLDV